MCSAAALVAHRDLEVAVVLHVGVDVDVERRQRLRLRLVRLRCDNRQRTVAAAGAESGEGQLVRALGRAALREACRWQRRAGVAWREEGVGGEQRKERRLHAGRRKCARRRRVKT
eukprot:6209994-Pleurochrysis_carterae.AAC.1